MKRLSKFIAWLFPFPDWQSIAAAGLFVLSNLLLVVGIIALHESNAAEQAQAEATVQRVLLKLDCVLFDSPDGCRETLDPQAMAELRELMACGFFQEPAGCEEAILERLRLELAEERRFLEELTSETNYESR